MLYSTAQQQRFDASLIHIINPPLDDITSACFFFHVLDQMHEVSDLLTHTQPHSHALKPKLSPESDEYVIEQLSSVEGKLVSLAEELSSRDLETIHKEMEDEEVCAIYSGKFLFSLRRAPKRKFNHENLVARLL